MVVSTTEDCGAGSLRAAVESVAAGGAITFAPGLAGTIALTNGDLLIDRPMTLAGPGADVIAISAGGNSRIFTFRNDASSL